MADKESSSQASNSTQKKPQQQAEAASSSSSSKQPTFTPEELVHPRLTKTGNPKNPYGLGDPNDRTLRNVEKEVLIPKKMREKARSEKCVLEEIEFSDCCKKTSLLMFITCKKQNRKLISCLSRWYEDEEFKKLCTEEYLEERSKYRRTGITKKNQRYLA